MLALFGESTSTQLKTDENLPWVNIICGSLMSAGVPARKSGSFTN